MSKHTPGPWKLVKDSEFPALGHVVAFDGDRVQQIESVAPLSREREVANARLIAASPTMYAAIHEILDTCGCSELICGTCQILSASIKGIEPESYGD